MKKALALLMSLLLAASLSSVAFADGDGLPASDDINSLVEAYGQLPIANPPVATEGQTAPPAENPEPESQPSELESSSLDSENIPPEPEISSSTSESTSSESENSLSSSESSQPESEISSSVSESTSSEPESSGDPPENENVGVIGEDPTDGNAVIDDITYEPEDRGDVFSARAMAFSMPVIRDPVPPTVIENEVINDVNANGSAWKRSSGIPDVDGATISPATKLVFAIPDDNFATRATTGGNFTDNLKFMNDNKDSSFKVKISKGTADYTDKFDVQFVSVAATSSGRAFGVQLTPKNITDELTLYNGTTFGFSAQNENKRYILDRDLLIVPSNSGKSKATGITDGAELGGAYTWVAKNGSLYTGGIEQIDDAMAGDEFLIHFSPQFFVWDGSTPAKVTLSNIRSKISLRQTGTTSSRIFEAVELTTSKGEAVVRIKFRENLSSTKPIDFKTKIYLTVKGKRHEDSLLDMEGTFGDADPEEFYSEDREIDISDGVIGEARETMSMVKVYIGEGITLTVPSIRKNSKFYGTVSTDFDKYDEELVEQYPDILQVYTLHTLGLNGAGVKVDIDTYNGYYFYDKDLNYLGQTAKKLEYSEKYYLAASMLDIEEEEEPESEPEDEPGFEDNPPSNNANRNPGTGAA